MIKLLNIKDDVIAAQIVDLQKKSYRIEAELIGSYNIPPLMDTIDTIKLCDETFYGYFVEDILAGLVSYKLEDSVLDIYRVAVHPDYFRIGIAKKLIQYISENGDYNRIVVATGSKNEPAKKLYLGFGFKAIGEEEVDEGIKITLFEKLR